MNKTGLFILLAVFSLGLNISRSVAAETGPVKKPGVKTLQLVSEQNNVVPGESVTIGLFIQHEPAYHTYWKAPGIVGVPTTIEWELPTGVTASDITWPMPELTKMAKYDCYGYERDVCLISDLNVPESFSGESLKLKARVAFMCCAKTCHPSWHDFEMEIPVAKAGQSAEIDRKWHRIIEQTRAEKPAEAPERWELAAVDSEEKMEITLSTTGKSFSDPEGAYCFPEDNFADSDEAQLFVRSDDKKSLTITVIKSGFGPDSLKDFTGLIYHPDGWPDTGSKWIRVKIPLQ